MIDDDYTLTKGQTTCESKLKPKADPKALEYLDNLNFRPIGYEW